MKTTPDNQKLLDLVSGARQGKIVLPQFQRDFVWSRDDITDLLVSILDGHFIGSFLLLETEHDNLPFAVRTLEGVDLPEGKVRPDRMILDGQQRLTSLHYVFAAPAIPLRFTKYPYRFFLDLKKITAGALDEAISSERVDYVNGMLDRQRQFDTLVIPFTEIENWDDWLSSYEKWLVNKDQSLYFNQYFPIDKPAWTETLNCIRSFLVPTLEIPKIQADDPERIAEVCAIFEKMNSKGVRLSVYDLLTARLYKDKIDQHDLWRQAVETHDLLNQFSSGQPDEYGVYVLRTIGLIRGTDVKSKTLINLNPANYEHDWHQAVLYMEKALQRITATSNDGFGVFDEKWAPYSTMVSPLAAMLYAIDHRNLDHRAYKLMRRWYWASVFRERYAGSVESTIYRDYQDFLKAYDDPAYEPAALADARQNIVENKAYSLRTINRVNSLYRGIMCLIALRGAKDFRADDSIEFHALEDHHIFPQAYLRDVGRQNGKDYPSTLINCILNRTLISGVTNRRISRKSPESYLEQVVPPDQTQQIMATHFIDADGLRAMKNNDFEAFLDAREFNLLMELHNRLS